MNFIYDQFTALFYEPTTKYGKFNQLVDTESYAPQCSLDLAKIVYKNINTDSISEKIAKCPDFLKRQFQPYKLSAFHLAVMSDNDAAMETLHNAKAKINLPDFQKYTPLHHAAMKGNTTAVSRLLTWGANPNSVNSFGGTYADLLRFNKPFRNSSDNEVDPNNYEVDAQCWGNDVTFVHENVAKPEHLIKQWSIPARTTNSIYPKEKLRAYQEFIQNPPPLEIKQIKPGMCGVFAMSDIKRGDVVAEYIGEVIDPSEYRNPTYLWEQDSKFHIDGATYRSAGAMINEGFPNVFIQDLHQSAKGLLDRYVVIALDDIAKGEQLVTSYGFGYKFTDFEELRQEAKDKFFKETSWPEIDKVLSNILANFMATSDLDALRKGLSMEFKVGYILSHPSFLEELAKANQLSWNDLFIITELWPKNFRNIEGHVMEGVSRATQVLLDKESKNS